MSEQEFELYLKLLSRCLSLTPRQREQIADELRDHLESRLQGLADAGVPREKAVLQALDEFGDAAVLATNFAAIARLKRRRFLMRLSLGSVGVLTAVLLIAFAFWPENRAVRGPERIAAQEKPAPALPTAQKAAEPMPATGAQPKKGTGRMAESAKAPVLNVCRPVTKEVTNYRFYAGNVRPSQLVQVRSQASGYLTNIDFKAGHVVKRGDPLFEIDPLIYQAEVEKASAELERGQARLEYARTQNQRVQHNFKNHAGSPEELDKAASEQRVAEADLRVARANLELAKVRLSHTHIRAPIDGHVSRSSFDVGSLVKAESNTLATIVCLDPVYVLINVDQPTWFALRKRVQHGEFRGSDIPVDMFVAAAGFMKQKGYLEFEGDADFTPDGTAAMRIRVPNKDAALVAGLFVQVRYEGNRHAAMLVPERALDMSGANPCVWVVDDQNRLRLRGVGQTELTGEANLREIKQGLKADEWIVCDVSHGPRPFDGMRIEPKRVP